MEIDHPQINNCKTSKTNKNSKNRTYTNNKAQQSKSIQTITPTQNNGLKSATSNRFTK